MTQRWSGIEPWEIEVCLGIRLRKPRYFSIGFPIDGFFMAGNEEKKMGNKTQTIGVKTKPNRLLIKTLQAIQQYKSIKFPFSIARSGAVQQKVESDQTGKGANA